MVIVLMGVSGSGKTTVGKQLAADLGWQFVEGDDYHPPENVAKMAGGTPLTDADRRPWLKALRQRIDAACAADENIVVACSALKHEYRDYLERDDPACVRYVYLRGSEDLFRARLEARKGHFMGANMLQSQLEAMEPPVGEVTVDAAPPPARIAADIRAKLGA
ncbi:gluconokinase [Gemmata sp. JC717]|uniref:gluconokinase n=1 Tax=Gemmata algarum TaxID=2975278 RepID=UPI0021BB6EB4|nr:gluconokinase [Gemmata algarum]MDY3552072.1 gluconokinase [Gemmata algarum]